MNKELKKLTKVDLLALIESYDTKQKEMQQELTALTLKVQDRDTLAKMNEEILTKLNEMAKSPNAEQKAEPKSFKMDDLFLEIQYDKEGNGNVKNYWGKLVNATIMGDRRYFQLLGEDNQYRMFNKDKTINKEEVAEAVEKLMTLRKVAAKDELYSAH